MARVTDKKAILIQTLQDGGCDQKTIAHCLELAEKGETKEIIRIMSQKKQNILDIVHKEQAKIDCLDYLVYQAEHGKLW